MVAGDPFAVNVPPVGLANLDQWTGDLLAICVCEDELEAPNPAGRGGTFTVGCNGLRALDQEFGGAVKAALEDGFAGKQGQHSPVIRFAGGARAHAVMLLGLGQKALVAAAPAVRCTLAGDALATAAKQLKARRVAVVPAFTPARSTSSLVAPLVAGVLSGLFEAIRYKSAPVCSNCVEQLDVLLVEDMDAAQHAALGEALVSAVAVSRGQLLTKALVEAPPNVCTPSYMENAAAHVAAQASGLMSLEVLEEEQCRQLGMGLYLGVNQGSHEPPKFIHLTYQPRGGTACEKVALVGKALCFDSGGYNLKVKCGIELMKIDMAGAAAVLGAAQAIALLQPADVEVHFIAAACQNMVDAKATRPSDIHKAASGKTVEVFDTDAEGRLTLADALWFAQEKCGAKVIVDIATLTGACIVGLGTKIGGLFSDDEHLAEELLCAAKRGGERLWRLPIAAAVYGDMLASDCADMKNYCGQPGGAITAALFLKEYIQEGVQWAHLDMAGPAWRDDCKPAGPTGFGCATLVEWVLARRLPAEARLGALASVPLSKCL